MIKKNIMTFKYSLLQATYWMLFCAIYAFAIPYLSLYGKSPSKIGSLLAIASIIGVITQPYAAKISSYYPLRKIIIYLLILFLFINTFLLLEKYMSVAFVILTSIIITIQPLIYSLGFEYINHGIDINFGLSRGMGSLAFAIASTFFGMIGNIYSFKFIPYILFILSLILIIDIYAMKIENLVLLSKDIKLSKTNFFKEYKNFSILLFAIILLFITHNIANTFMIRIMEYLGGNSATTGYAYSIAAMVELPIMFLFSYIALKFKYGTLMKISCTFFSIKMIAISLSTTVHAVYLAQALQVGAYALFVPASVYYANVLMKEKDRVKGQAYITTAGTIGAIIGNGMGGYLLDISMNVMLIFSVVITVIGTIIAFMSIE